MRAGFDSLVKLQKTKEMMNIECYPLFSPAYVVEFKVLSFCTKEYAYQCSHPPFT